MSRPKAPQARANWRGTPSQPRDGWFAIRTMLWTAARAAIIAVAPLSTSPVALLAVLCCTQRCQATIAE